MTGKQSQSSAAKAHFRPPWVSLLYASGAFLGCLVFYGWQRSGNELGGPLLLGAGVLTVMQLSKALDDHFKVQIHRRRRKRFKEYAWHYGEGRWANMNDLQREELVGPDKHGVLMGSFEGKDVVSSSFNSGNIIGPPGSGKSTSIYISTAFRTIDVIRKKGSTKTAPSFIFNDPSAQIYATTSKALEEAGYKIVVLSSWTEEISHLLNEEVKDSKIDIVASTIDQIGRPKSLIDDGKRACKLLIPNEKPGTSEETRFFNMGGRSIILFAILYLAWKCYKVTFKNVLNVLQSDVATLREMFVEVQEAAAANEAKREEEARQEAEKAGIDVEDLPRRPLTIEEDLEKYLCSVADGLRGIKDHAPEQFSAYMGTVLNATEPYGFSNVETHIQEGFDAKELKYGERPVAVFLIYPAERVETHQAMLNAELTHMLETVCKGRKGRTTIAMIDECFGIGYIPSILRFLAEGRKFGLRLFLGWQDMAQAEHLYSKSGLAQILAAGEVLWASGVREPGFCQMLQKILSVRAVDDLSMNERSRSSGPIADETFNNQHRSIPLMRDIRTELESDEALLIYKNMKPAKLTKVPYFSREEWLKMAGESPYGG